MGTITEDYVSFETAKLLKEKGFDEGCRARYGTAGSFCYEKYEVEASGCEMHNAILAPTLQMAMKWLREVHNLYIDIRININNSLYSFQIYSVGISGARAFTEYRIESYEAACEEAIKYCLEKLI
jgi:hypothetical protein